MIERFQKYLPLFDAFEAEGHSLYLVGGCVRDVVMGASAVGDVDLATDSLPEQTKEILVGAGFKAFPIGEKFGTITTLLGDVPVEITTLRVGELYQPGSRHPQVVFGTDITADLSRRDLSLNAMAMGRDGVIIDPYGGHRAIEERMLEVPGGGYENTVSILRDDPLRLLRIARFAARFGFPPTTDTTKAAAESSADLRHISHERWRVEMEKTLLSPHLDVGFLWLVEVGGLAQILPMAAGLDEAQARVLCSRLDVTEANATSRWAVLLLSLMDEADWFDGEEARVAERRAIAIGVAEDFRFSNKERKALAARVMQPLTRHRLMSGLTTPELRRFYADSPSDAWSRVSVAEALADGDEETLQGLERLKKQLTQLLETEDPVPKLPSGLGASLVKEFSLRGPAIGAAMERLRDAVFEGLVPNHAERPEFVAYFRGLQESELE